MIKKAEVLADLNNIVFNNCYSGYARIKKQRAIFVKSANSSAFFIAL